MMSSSDAGATSEDMDKLLALLREYTVKLREQCEEYESSRFRRLQSMITAVTSLGAAVAVAVFAFRQFEMFATDMTISLIAALMGGVLGFGSLLLFVQSSGTSRISRSTWDTRQVAATVEKLIATASQYRDHSSRRISDLFEFDLRMAEAETALSMFNHIFRPRSGSIFVDALTSIIGR